MFQETIERKELERVVSLVKPALASQSYIDALTHIYFDGEYARAYNDKTLIAVKCPLKLGMLPGDLLIKALGTLSAAEILLQSEDGVSCSLSAGRAKLKLPILQGAHSLFDLPAPGRSFPLHTSTLKGIEMCLMGVGNDPTHPAAMGVTLFGGELFSTDNYTVTRYQSSASVDVPGEVAVILPTEFCQRLLELHSEFDQEPIMMSLLPSVVVARFGEQAVLCSKLLVDVEPLDFHSIFSAIATPAESFGSGSSDIPASLDAAISRAALIQSSELEKITSISVKGGRMKLHSVSKLGEATDSCTFGVKEVPECFVDPTKIQRALKYTTAMEFLPNAVALTSEDKKFTHLLAHSVA